jgi:hypothetical protein
LQIGSSVLFIKEQLSTYFIIEEEKNATNCKLPHRKQNRNLTATQETKQESKKQAVTIIL